MSLVSLLKSVNKGWLKDVLVGAGLTLGTSGATLTLINTMIGNFKGSLGSVSADLLGLAHLAGIDYAMSIVLGAVVAKWVQQSANLTLQKLKK